MRKIIPLLIFLGTLSTASAAELPPEVILDKIMFQVSGKQWVTTKTALLTVSINATLSSADLVKARAEIMTQLGKIAKGDWHLTQFDRSQDSSGLEKLSVVAQARVPQEALTTVYQNAKTVSKPGTSYSIDNVEFKPSLEETQEVRANVRQQLYQQINEELALINKNFPEQKYSLSQLVFIEGGEPAQFKTYQARQLNTAAMTAAPAPDLSVSNELIITAMVAAASNRQKGNTVVSP